MFQGAIIGIDDEDDSTFTITVDDKTFHFQGIWFCYFPKFFVLRNNTKIYAILFKLLVAVWLLRFSFNLITTNKCFIKHSYSIILNLNKMEVNLLEQIPDYCI